MPSPTRRGTGTRTGTRCTGKGDSWETPYGRTEGKDTGSHVADEYQVTLALLFIVVVPVKVGVRAALFGLPTVGKVTPRGTGVLSPAEAFAVATPHIPATAPNSEPRKLRLFMGNSFIFPRGSKRQSTHRPHARKATRTNRG